MAETTASARPWGSLPQIDPDPPTPMCGTVNGKIICCRSRGHAGAHATPFPSARRHGPVWVYWGGPPLGPFGSCHATDPKTSLYCGLEKGHEGDHLSPSNQGPGATLAEWDASPPSPGVADVAGVYRIELGTATTASASVPERSSREGDQALPWKGGESVFAAIRSMLDSRESIGIRRYGRSLETFNGRDAHRDEIEEFLDGFVYRQQMRLERAALEAELVQLRSDLDLARADLASHVEALDRRCADLKAERDDTLADFETARRAFAGAQADLMARVETLREQLEAARANASKAMAERDAALLQLGRPAEGLAR